MNKSVFLSKLSMDPTRLWRLSKESMLVLCGQAGSILANLLLVRLLTSYLNSEQYGSLTLALSLGTLICQLAFSGSMPGIFRYYTVAVERKTMSAFFLASQRLMSWGVMIAASLSLLLLCGLKLTGKTNEWQLIVAIAVTLSIVGSYNALFSMIQNAARQRKTVLLHSLLESWLRVFFVATCIFFVIKASVAWVVLIYLFVLLFVVSSQLRYIKRLIPERTIFEKRDIVLWSRQIWLYSKPYVLFNLFTWLGSYSDRWVLVRLATIEDVGLYTVLVQLGYTPICMACGLVMAFMTPIIFQRSGQVSDPVRIASARRLIWLLTLSTLGFAIMGFAFTWILHDEIFRWFVDDRYWSISYLLPWMVLAGGLFSAGQILSEKLLCTLNSSALIAPKIISSLLGLILNVIGVYLAGLSGAITALIANSALYLIWIFVITDTKQLTSTG